MILPKVAHVNCVCVCVYRETEREREREHRFDSEQGKSKIYFSKGRQNKEELKTIIRFLEGQFPTEYLGTPLSIAYLKPRHYSSLIDKCRGRLEGWGSQILSFPGRIELVKAMLHGIFGYCLSAFLSLFAM